MNLTQTQLELIANNEALEVEEVESEVVLTADTVEDFKREWMHLSAASSQTIEESDVDGVKVYLRKATYNDGLRPRKDSVTIYDFGPFRAVMA